MNFKQLILTQVIMTLMMAFSMSGILSYIAVGGGAAWPAIWLKQFLLAWPIAFAMTNICFPIASKLSSVILRVPAEQRAN